MTQLSMLGLMIPEPIPLADRVPPFRLGWERCECDLVHWIYPVERCGDAPEIRPITIWTCRRRINRASTMIGRRRSA